VRTGERGVGFREIGKRRGCKEALAEEGKRRQIVTRYWNASVAQLVEQKTLNLFVEGSNPSGGTTLVLENCFGIMFG